LHMDDNLSKAQGYFDKVRDRAFGDNTHNKAVTNDQAGKDLIFEERRFELALEANRYWDLLRYDGIAGNFAYAESKINTDLPYYQHFRPETQGLLGIPTNQINLEAGALVQNPGW
jgi:SusD family.